MSEQDRAAVEALNNGTQAWNSYVEENGKPEVLSGIIEHSNLENADLSDIRAGTAGLIFNHNNMNGSDLSGVSGDIHMSHNQLNNADFSGSNTDLSNTTIINSNGSNVDFSEAKIDGMTIESSNLQNSNFSNTNTQDHGEMGRASIRILGGSDISGSNLDGANWSSAQIEHTKFDNINDPSGNIERAVSPVSNPVVDAVMERAEARMDQNDLSIIEHSSGRADVGSVSGADDSLPQGKGNSLDAISSINETFNDQASGNNIDNAPQPSPSYEPSPVMNVSPN